MPPFCVHTRVDDVLVRLGRDEFLMVIRHISSIEVANKKEMAILRSFGESRYADSDSLACFGGTAIWNAKEPWDEIIRRVQEAIDAAQAGGKEDCLLRKG